MSNLDKMYKLDSHLYQGGVPANPSALWKRLNAAQDDWAVVSLTEKHEINFDELDCIHLKFPIPDAEFPGIKWLDTVVDCIEALTLTLERNVLVHCRAGISRSSMVCAAFFMRRYGWKRDKALNYIGGINGSIDPSPAFLKGLDRWEKHIRIVTEYASRANAPTTD